MLRYLGALIALILVLTAAEMLGISVSPGGAGIVAGVAIVLWLGCKKRTAA
jgi:hypothetical protein